MNNKKVGFETKDISFGALVTLIGILFILLGGTMLLTHFFDRWFRRDYSWREDASSSMEKPSQLPPEPRLQVNSTVDLIRLRDVEDVTLNNYAWIDPSAGRVRIPITRAMDILAARGLPSRSASDEKSE